MRCLLQVACQEIFGQPEELPEHVVGEVGGVRRRCDRIYVGEALLAGEGCRAGDVEVAGYQSSGGARRGHEKLAELNVLNGVESLILDDYSRGIYALLYKVLFHSLAFGEGFVFAFASGNDAEGGFIFFQVIDGRVEAVFENRAGAVFADLSAEDDQVVQAGRRAAAEAAKNKSFTESTLVFKLMRYF